MKTKMMLFIAFSAIATLSFTFVATRNDKTKNEPVKTQSVVSAPAGGLISEETR